MMAMLRLAFVLLPVVLPVGLGNVTDWKEHPWEANSLNCEQGLREFNPVTQKQKYTIGIHAPAGIEAAYREFNLTFQDYLNEAVGKRFEPPIEFTLKATNRPLRDWLDIGEEVDFFYTDTGIFSCIGTEIGAQPLATTVARLTSHKREYDLDVFAGTMMVRSDNREINSVTDLKDKVIGAQNFFDFAGGQAQFYVMYRNGVDFVVDPKQVIFTANNEDTVQGVLDGRWDVGFVRTGQVERTINPATGDFVDPDLVKVIDPRIHRLDDGTLFPFLHTTPVFPEWPLGARNHVDRIVSEEVASAMINMGYHSSIGEAIYNCHKEATTDAQKEICDTMPPTYFDQKARCDTTRELAELAFIAGKAGFHNGFRPPRSHFSVRTMQQDAGFIIQDEFGDWHCERDDTLYDGIFCPKGYYKVAEEIFETQCEESGRPCPDGYSCYCKPCVKAFEVNVYPAESSDSMVVSDFNRESGCAKMDVCGKVQQGRTITMNVFDNRQRASATFLVVAHFGDEEKELPVTEIEPFLFQFSFSDNKRGVAILELYVDGIQIPESPLRLQVTERDCEEDFPRRGMVSDDFGKCICAEGTVEIGSQCMPSSTFAAIIALGSVLLVLQLSYCYMSYRRRKNDEIWQVNHEELGFDHPVQIVGQGAFGVVILADYRGTRVAIKRVLPLEVKLPATEANSDLESGRNSISNSDGNYSKENQGDLKTGIGNKESDSDDLDSLGFEDTVGLPKTTLFSRLVGSSGSGRSGSSNLTILNMSTTGNSSTAGVVMRMFLPWCDKNRRRQQEFVKEMRLLSRLRHPCITTVMGAVMSARDPMMVMEYMENGSLYDLLRNDTAYTGGEIIMQIVRDIAQGLRFLHASKPPILHRDLKAKNILIDSRFRAKVADFGIAIKNSNGLSGTPFWMAPEYLSRKKPYSRACDVYSFGMIIYEIYSRKIPFEGLNPRKVLRKVCSPRINYRPRIPVTVPKRMAEIMKKCWSPNPSFRPEAKDLDLIFNDMSARDAEPLIDEGNTRLRTEVAAGDMLYKVFPKKVADQLKAGQKVEPETHSNVTVFFSDIVRFTDISRALPAVKVCNMLDRLYLAFDNLANKHEVFKVETIGDAWVGVTNLEGNQNTTHVKRIAAFAVDAVAAAAQVRIDEDDPTAGHVHIRVGFHSGSVVSNVIGSLNPRYGLFGDTMNTASRMESLSISGQIHCSEVSARLLKEQAPEFPMRKRGKVTVKGKGVMVTYWVGESTRNQPLGSSERSHKLGAFDERPPKVKFLSPGQHSDTAMKRISTLKSKKVKVGMDGSLQAAIKDSSDSFPSSWKYGAKQSRSDEMKLWGSFSSQ